MGSRVERGWTSRTAVVIASGLLIVSLGYVSEDVGSIFTAHRVTIVEITSRRLRRYRSEYHYQQSLTPLTPSPKKERFSKNTKREDIQHWCLGGKTTACNCLDPFLAVRGKVETPQIWMDNFFKNREKAQSAPEDLDVVLLGDSITNFWNQYHSSILSTIFSKKNGAEFEGIGLGINGDAAPNLLWRIQNGEIPPSLKPKLWWVLVGANDLGSHIFHPNKEYQAMCSEEVVVTGIIQVVKELQKIRPDAMIVVNGLLPRSNSKKHCDLSYGAPVEQDTWRAVENINKELEQFCETDEKLHYFDVKKAFIAFDNEKNMYIPKELDWTFDCMHPGEEGYKRMAILFKKKLHKLLA